MSYEFEKHLNTQTFPSKEYQIAALQVGLVSLVKAIEKTNPGFGTTFLETFDSGFKAQREANQMFDADRSPVEAIALLGTMIKSGL